MNFTEGGPLTILRECLGAACEELGADWEICALVHSSDLISLPRVKTIVVPDAKRSWLRRLWHEWHTFHRFSTTRKVDLWFSLHDITPNVVARRQAVYCHNPAPFYSLPWREALLDPGFFLFNRFYSHLYGAFIRRNSFVVVQQQWLRRAFENRFGKLPLVVAHPESAASGHSANAAPSVRSTVFLYPALPRVFKNFETILEAARLISEKSGYSFELRLTLSGTENRYAAKLKRRFGRIPGVHFIGRQSLLEMEAQYASASVVVFPSKLETWGLPISEAKARGKPLLMADLPYAHETVGDYELAEFVPAEDPKAWEKIMTACIEGNWKPARVYGTIPAQPFARNWRQLWKLLVEGLD